MSLIMLYFAQDIISFVTKPSYDIFLLPVIFLYMLQIGADLLQYYNMLSLGFSNHFYSDP